MVLNLIDGGMKCLSSISEQTSIQIKKQFELYQDGSSEDFTREAYRYNKLIYPISPTSFFMFNLERFSTNQQRAAVYQCLTIFFSGPRALNNPNRE
jgi:hypothetical protein